jgi:hypothetical protein
MNEEKRARLKHIKEEAGHPKSELLNLLRELDGVSAREARRLEKIIARLEMWQNS